MSQLGRTFVPLVLGAGLVASANTTQESVQGLEDALDALIEEAQEEMELSSGSVVVAIGDELLHTSTFGVAEPGGSRRTGLDTPFVAQSLAHTWLSTVILQYRAEGDVELDARLGLLLPDLVGEGCPVHVTHLLNQSSGLADYTDFIAEQDRRGASYAELLEPLKTQVLVTEPGECVAPTPTNTLLLAALLEKLSGEPAASVLQARIFDPLGMSSSGYLVDEERSAVIEASAGRGSEALRMAGLRSSARDLIRFQRGLIDRELLGTEDFKVMVSATCLLDGTTVASGMGIRRISAGGSAGFLIGGGDACVAYFPEHDLSVASMARAEDPRLDQLATRLAARVMEAPKAEPADIYLSRSEMLVYLGTYRIGCNALYIRPGVGRIVLDRVDGGEDVLLYQGGQRFIARGDPGIEITFDVVGVRAVSFTLVEHGRRSIATRFDSR